MTVPKKSLSVFPLKLLQNEQGFTVMESLVVLFLFSLFQIWFWQGLTHSQISMLTIIQRQKEMRTLLSAKEMTQRMLHTIEIPFYLAEAPFVLGDSFLSFEPSVFDGGTPFILSLDRVNEELYIQTKDQELSIQGISDLQFTPIRSPSSQKQYALHIRFFHKSGRYIDLYHYTLGVIP
jgi:hypothetical protein